LTHDEAANLFLLSLSARGRSGRTVEEYRKRLRILEALPCVLEETRPEHVDRALAGLRARGLAAATIGSAVQTLRTFFLWCVRRGYLASSPAGELRRPKPESGCARKAARQDDLQRMIAQARRDGDLLELAVILFLVDSAARAGELIAVNLADLDLERLECQTRGKTGERVLDFTRPTADALRAWLDARPASDACALFTTRGGRLTEWGLYKLLWRLAKRTGNVRKFCPQSIRHRVGQGWIDAGANLELVRLKLGHKHISTTSMFYAHQDRPRMRAATQRYSLVS